MWGIPVRAQVVSAIDIAGLNSGLSPTFSSDSLIAGPG
jgi:hypothetical protein